MKRLFFIQVFFSIYWITNHLLAVPAYPYPKIITQPDGTLLTIRLHGDEYHHYYTTEDNYLLVKNKNGAFNYAQIDDNGALHDTGILAKNEEFRTDFEKNIAVSSLSSQTILKNQNAKMRARRSRTSSSTTQQRPHQFPLIGSPKSLVILVEFSDLKFSVSDTNDSFTRLLNEDGYSDNGGTGSARDYFRDNSLGKFIPNFDVVGPYILPNPYAYYGENASNGEDKNPVQMIIDACIAASADGIDFSEYDTDNDGLVDNVFVFYAGYNEAEYGGDNTIWPHRWGIYPSDIFYSSESNYSGTSQSVTFNGKRVEDYACTSELRGNSGANMAGMATFTHEFGHVLGLADMYTTNGASHHTLSYWSIMDWGTYLNNGRTPPNYNSFEKFQLGFATPTLLTEAKNISLNPWHVSSQCFLISPTDTHNLDGSNPSPNEFILLENRQKSGWDRYLPGHGMLAYRIVYNSYDWNNNIVNNSVNKMGVDIIEADGIASNGSLSGDPYPGTSNVTSFIPSLRDGTVLSDKDITFITETNEIIKFRYKGGAENPILDIKGSFKTFSTTQGEPSAIQSITVAGKKLVSNLVISFSSDDHFQMKVDSEPESSWRYSVSLTPTDSVVNSTTIQVRYNPSVPSYSSYHFNAVIISSDDAQSISIEANGKSSKLIDIVPPVATNATEVTDKSFIANWTEVSEATGYYLTVIEHNNDGTTTPILSEEWTESVADTIYNLNSAQQYSYKVRASDKNTVYHYENITDFSNTIKVTTLDYPGKQTLRAVVQTNGAVKVFAPAEDINNNNKIIVYSSVGQKIFETPVTSRISEIYNLPKQTVLIILLNNRRAKLILP